MNHRDERFVRFQDLNSERALITGRISSCGKGKRFSWIVKIFYKLVQFIQETIRSTSFDKSMKDSALEEPQSRKKVLDPQGTFLQRWNKIFVLSCVIAVSVDPLFFYIPIINDNNNCLYLDKKLETTASTLRSFTDIFYVLHIIFQFRTGFIAPSSRVFGRGVLVEDSSAIAKRYLSSYFLIDILAVLPLPQVVVLIIVPRLKESSPLDAKDLLMLIILFQYVPRLIRIIPLYMEVTRSAGIITETAWAGAAFNLLLYMLASHVLGAFWYLLSVQREDACWKHACSINNCNITSWYCGKENGQDNGFVVDACPIQNPNSSVFDFGIYQSALKNIVQTRNFPQKFFYCFWWGLQNLSSLGQNLSTSTYVWEASFNSLLVNLRPSLYREKQRLIKLWQTDVRFYRAPSQPATVRSSVQDLEGFSPPPPSALSDAPPLFRRRHRIRNPLTIWSTSFSQSNRILRHPFFVARRRPDPTTRWSTTPVSARRFWPLRFPSFQR